MKVNPQELSWTAPTENTDGTPIDYALAYELGWRIDPAAAFEPVASFPGQLNPDGSYRADIPAFNFPGDQVFQLALNAFRQDAPQLKSDWSNAIEVLISGKVPLAPASFDVL